MPSRDQGASGSYTDFVNLEDGLVDRRIFTDEGIYKAELQQIFSRCWLYLVHESEIPAPGDYVAASMGTTPVLVCRGTDGEVRAFVNSCRHRGNRVCRDDRGNAKSFVCSYHGWAYDRSGSLVGVPGQGVLYNESFDKSQLGLIPVATVASYGGLVFACLDAAAPTLDDYLGDMRWGLDLLLAQGDLVAVPGLMRWSADCNWKFAADNAIGDTYHAYWTHRSSLIAGHLEGNGATVNQGLAKTFEHEGFTMVTEYGHGFNADYLSESVDWDSPLVEWRSRPEVQSKLGALRQKVHRANQNVFPNLFVNTGSRDLILRNPLGPTRTEFLKTTLTDGNLLPEVQREQIRASNRHFGPAGMFEQDDGENWEQSTHGARASATHDYPLHYGMSVGCGEVVRDGQSPPRVESVMNEHAQLWMYRVWAEFMDAASWLELERSHSKPEDTL